MPSHSNKSYGRQSRVSADQDSLKKEGGEAVFSFVENRPEAKQLARIQEMLNNSPQANKTTQLQAMVDGGPRMVAQRQQIDRVFGTGIQQQEVSQEEAGLLQGKFESVGRPAVKEAALRQGKFVTTATADRSQTTSTPSENRTGLPDALKAGIENLSGVTLDNVNVHYNSAKPAQLQALAYTQGTDIHIAPGQDQHLPHEAWHLVQQKQGRVRPTLQAKGPSTGLRGTVAINDDGALEREADVMGAKALQLTRSARAGSSTTSQESTPSQRGKRAASPIAGHRFASPNRSARAASIMGTAPIQRRVGFEFEMGDILTQHWGLFSGWHDHSKGDVLARHPGYELTADEGAGNTQLEVIINHIDETNVGQVANLVNVTGPAVVAMIGNIATGAYGNWTRADQIAGVNGSSWDRYRSYTNGAQGIQGQLQMTGGIATADLWDHVSGAQATGYLATLNPMVNADDVTAHNTLNAYTAGPIAAQALLQVNAHNVLGGLALPARQQIAAVAGMMATIPYNTRAVGNLPYPKSAAGPLLARTDFSKIMMLLPDAAKAALTPAIMRQIVLGTINALGLPNAVAGADAVIPLGAGLPLAAPAFGNLTINNWVGSVVPTPGLIWGYWQGTDRLTKRNYPGTRQQREWLESLGSYGSRVDNGNLPIFEFRSLGGVFVPDLVGQLDRLLGFMIH